MSYFPSVAFLTESVGTGEWIVLFVVILIVVGPKRLPDVVRKIGRTMEMFRRAADEFKDQLMTMDQESHSGSDSSTGSTASTDANVGSPAEGETDPYAQASDYPGNEEHVENWTSESQLSPPAEDGQTAAPAVAETAETPPQSIDQPTSPEKPAAEGGA